MTKFVENTESDLSCPRCDPPRRLIVKTNRNNDNQFLGCPNYPNCDYTRDIPEAWKMRAAGQAGLFDNLPAPAVTPDDACAHMRVNVYSRCVSIQTWEEPAEYEFKVVCKDCGIEMDVGEIPEGAEETEAEWEPDYPDWDG